MLAKLLSLIGTAKGATAAAVVAATVTGGVVAANPDVQQAVQRAAENLTAQCAARPSGSGKPALVGARNAADKLLRDAYHEDQTALEKLRGTRVDAADRGKLENALRDADASLHARYQKALDEVATLTLGRYGHEEQADTSAGSSGKPTSCEKASVRANASTDAKALDGAVAKAVDDMNSIVATATSAVEAMAASAPGKPSDAASGKPSDALGGKPSDDPGGKPSEAPPAKPSAAPSR